MSDALPDHQDPQDIAIATAPPQAAWPAALLKGTAGILATGISRPCMRRKKSCCATWAPR
jgi:hypothetical protein